MNGVSVLDARFRALPSSIAGLYKCVWRGQHAEGTGQAKAGAVPDEALSVWDSAKERDL